LSKYQSGDNSRGKKYAASTISTFILDTLQFVTFLRLRPELVSHFDIPVQHLDDFKTILSNCQTAFSSRRLEQDQERRLQELNVLFEPAVFGEFLASERVSKTFCRLNELRQQLDGDVTLREFCDIRDMMLCAGLTNARRTGDLVNMTVAEFEAARTSKTNPDDHVVHVKHHKTALTQQCKVNFYSKLHTYATTYVQLFRGKYLEAADPPDGRMFPQAVARKKPCPMRGSIYNHRIKRIWGMFADDVNQPGDPAPRIPSEKVFCSTFIRNVFVSKIHSGGNDKEKRDAASQMAHKVSTAEAHYDVSGGLEVSSRATAVFRWFMGEKNLHEAGITFSAPTDDADESSYDEQEAHDAVEEEHDEGNENHSIDSAPVRPMTSGVPPAVRSIEKMKERQIKLLKRRNVNLQRML